MNGSWESGAKGSNESPSWGSSPELAQKAQSTFALGKGSSLDERPMIGRFDHLRRGNEVQSKLQQSREKRLEAVETWRAW